MNLGTDLLGLIVVLAAGIGAGHSHWHQKAVHQHACRDILAVVVAALHLVSPHELTWWA